MKRESRASLERSVKRQDELIREIRKQKNELVAQTELYASALNLQKSLMLCLVRRIPSMDKGVTISKKEIEEFSASYEMNSMKSEDTVTIFVSAKKGDDKDAAQADQHLRTETREGNGSI